MSDPGIALKLEWAVQRLKLQHVADAYSFTSTAFYDPLKSGFTMLFAKLDDRGINTDLVTVTPEVRKAGARIIFVDLTAAVGSGTEVPEPRPEIGRV